MKNPILEGKRAYLSGPIEHSENNTNWRVEPVNVLTQEFKIDLHDPFADPKQQWTTILKEAQGKKDYEEMRRIAKKFVRKDLQMVQQSLFLIAYVPRKVPTTGTVHEIVNSINQKTPTLLVADGCKDRISLWYYGIVPHECMFDNWEGLYDYLREVNDWKHTHNNRWDLVYGLV